MIITRKIELIPYGGDNPDLVKQNKRDIVKQLYSWRDLTRKAANAVVSHKFIQQNLADFEYVKDSSMEEFLELKKDKSNRIFAKDVIKEGPGLSEQNVTYRIISRMLKGKMPAAIYSSLNQSVANSYKEKIADVLSGKASIPSYSNIPIPFPAANLKLTPYKKTVEDEDGKEKQIETYLFDFFHLPFELFFGKDLSGNRIIVKRCLEGKYKFCGSSIKIKDANPDKGTKMKIFLLLSVDIPEKKSKMIEGKTLYASLGLSYPIMCDIEMATLEKLRVMEEKNELLDFVESVGNKKKGFFNIGTKEEFLHRRLQIQDALRRAQANCKYTEGGHGRKKRTKNIQFYHKLEYNYVDYKAHVYSRQLVRLAQYLNCEAIYLVDQPKKEKDAKKDEFILRNWSYSGLKNKICYKAAKVGIKVVVPKEKKEKEDI